MGAHGIAEGFPQQLGPAHVRNGVGPAYNTLKGHEHKGTGTINSAEPMHQTCPPFPATLLPQRTCFALLQDSTAYEGSSRDQNIYPAFP